MAIATEQIETQRKLGDRVRLQYQKGVASELQLRQAEGAFAQVAASLPVLRTGLEAALNALDVLTGAQPGAHREVLSVAKPIPVVPAISGIGSPSALLQTRPDPTPAEQALLAPTPQLPRPRSDKLRKHRLK